MFEGATLFSGVVATWNVNNVTNISSMFKNSGQTPFITTNYTNQQTRANQLGQDLFV
jgi:hypothetical protein